MADQKIMTGARAEISLSGDFTNSNVGIFTNCSWGVSLDVQPNFILGSFRPVGITYVGAEPVRVDCRGFYIPNNGAYAAAGFTKLQELITGKEINITIVDRGTGAKLAVVTGCKPVSWDTSTAAKGISEFSVSFLGLMFQSDENKDDDDGGLRLP